MTKVDYVRFLIGAMTIVEEARKCAKEINSMIEKELCAVCDKPLCGEDVAHDKCYLKELKDRQDDFRHPDER